MLTTNRPSVKEIRKSYGLTQEQMARVLGYAWATISRWDRGVSEPPSGMEEKLARMHVLRQQLEGLVDPRDLPKFLLTPNKAMNNFPPSDLLQSGYAFQKLMELVDKAKHGEFS